MRTKAGIRTIWLRKVLMLAGTACLLLLTAADGPKPEELTEHLHVTWVANWELHSSGVNSKSDSSDHITIELDATAHGTAPAGTKPWQMNPTITAYHYTVSGNGSLAMTQKDEWTKGSWTWALAETPENPSQIIVLDNGSFSVAQFGLGELKIEPQGQVESGGKGVPTQSFPASLMPTSGLIAVQGVHDVVITKSFYDQLSGTFDPNSKAFTKSGKASGSHSGPWSEGVITGSVEAEYSLNFNQQPEEVEAILVPQKGYEEWMPEAGDDEDTPGNGLLVNVVLQKKDKPGEKPTAKAKSFKFELTGISKEPGVCLNWPPKEKTKKDPDFDLTIDKDANPSLQVSSKGQTATSTGDSQEGSVIVFSYDWGAWGSLKVTAELDNGQTVVAHLQNKPSMTQLKIPKDDNDNRIADGYEIKNESSDPKADDDADPEGDHKGDVLSYYEEYRGFMTGGDHTRTNNNRKDVFIYDRDDIGVGHFANSGMGFHFLNRDEYTQVAVDSPGHENARVVNFNYDFAHLGYAHVLKLMNHYVVEDPGRLGHAVGGPGTPKSILSVYIDVWACHRSKWGDEELQNTLAHELAHACNVQHHGDSDYEPVDIWKQGSNGVWFPIGLPSAHWVAARGGQHSGSTECVMRYHRGQFYEKDGGHYRWKKTRAGEWIQGERWGVSDEPGTVFCKAKDGEPPNPRLGDADRGTCSKQFCVNDLEHKVNN